MFLFPARSITAVKVYSFKCNSCGYEAKLPLGSADLDQTLTDVNADYAEYRLFICKKESKFVHADIHDKSFEGKCPSDGTRLEEVEPKQAKCPRCGRDLEIHEFNPLAASDSSAE
jgi:predicted RNA-binding Zn-ribbon protein involved in translation (DUF1610 family)